MDPKLNLKIETAKILDAIHAGAPDKRLVRAITDLARGYAARTVFMAFAEHRATCRHRKLKLGEERLFVALLSALSRAHDEPMPRRAKKQVSR